MNSLKERIEDGLAGKYQGLANGFDRLNQLIHYTQRKTYTLIGGLSGSAKTTLVNYMLINTIEDAINKNIPLDVFYYSYEIDEETTKINWLSVLIYKKHKIIIPPEKIAGLGNNRLTPVEQGLVYQELPNLDKLLSNIKFRFDPTNPTGVYNELYEHAGKVGTFKYDTYTSGGETKKRVIGYEFNDPNRYVIVVVDHISLLRLERGFSVKENLDKFSEYCVLLRNLCGYSFFNISQFNQTLNTVDRQKFKGIDISPQQNDFKNTGNTYEDSDIAIGIMNPWKMDMKESLGYDLKILEENFRMIKIIKNRKGKDNRAIGVYFNPSGGSFHELPEVGTPELLDVYNRLKNRK